MFVLDKLGLAVDAYYWLTAEGRTICELQDWARAADQQIVALKPLRSPSRDLTRQFSGGVGGRLLQHRYYSLATIDADHVRRTGFARVRIGPSIPDPTVAVRWTGSEQLNWRDRPPRGPLVAPGPKAQGWRSDHTGRHESRWYSLGYPTALVMDGAMESSDPIAPTELPPAVDVTAPTGLERSDPLVSSRPEMRGGGTAGAPTRRRPDVFGGLVVTSLVFLSCVLGVFALVRYAQGRSRLETVRSEVGERIVLPASDEALTGVASVLVYGLRYPVPPADANALEPFGAPLSQYSLAAVDVQECAGLTRGLPTDPENFYLLVAGAQSPVGGQAVDTTGPPSFAAAGPLSPGGCVRGYISFVLPTHAQPLAVRYTPILAGDLHFKAAQYQWDLGEST